MTEKPIRSRSYPGMSLRDALEAVAKIEGQYRTNPVYREAAAKLIGYSGLSGPANMALAALAAYGLVERAGKGQMRVTSRARAILHAANEEEKRNNMLAAAMEPQLFQDIRDRFEGIAIPPDEGVRTYLNREGFNPNAVGPATKAFLDTMRFIEEETASKRNGDEEADGPESEGPDDKGLFGGAAIGDLILWESNGALQFKTPRRVRWISGDGNWVAVEGSNTGIPMSEVIVEQSASAAPPSVPPFEDSADSHSRGALEKGESEWMRNKLGKETDVRLLTRGQMGPKEIGRLIRLLQAQKEVLEDEGE